MESFHFVRFFRVNMVSRFLALYLCSCELSSVSYLYLSLFIVQNLDYPDCLSSSSHVCSIPAVMFFPPHTTITTLLSSVNSGIAFLNLPP
jgi:hypothetical protein